LTARRLTGAIAAATMVAVLSPRLAAADGTISGSVSLVDPARRNPGPERSRGFVARAPNPLKPPRPFNPLPYLVVAIEGGPVSAEDRQPPREPVRFSIIGESFARPVLPVVTGSGIEIRNEGKASPRLVAPAQPDLVPSEPINPKGVRLIKKFAANHQAVEIRDPDSAHLSAMVVGFPDRFFATVDDNGKFELTGVPAGDWTVRVWYRDGWADGVVTKVTVQDRHTAQVKLALPAELKSEPAGAK
jgi:hypothetical protein